MEDYKLFGMLIQDVIVQEKKMTTLKRLNKLSHGYKKAINQQVWGVINQIPKKSVLDSNTNRFNVVFLIEKCVDLLTEIDYLTEDAKDEISSILGIVID
jgi:hypothetical protein